MNAAKAKKNPAKVKGAVLIMILAVMTVLIILLAGSIAVVYSAHNRAYVKYSESQGYYTARSILDNFFSELTESTDLTDSTGAAVGTYYKLDLENGTTISKDLCMGRSIELELYKAKVQVKDASGNYYDWFTKYCDENKDALNAQLKGFDATITNDLNGLDLYAKVEKYYVNLSQSDLDDYSTYQNFYKQYLPVSTIAAGMSGDTIIYEIPSLDGFGSGTIDTDGDGTADTNSNYGKLSDVGASKAWLTVQVIERIYAMGAGTSYADRFKAGKRSEDHIVAKVVAHVIYEGEEVTTTQIWYNNPPPVVDADTGLSTLGPLDTTTSLTAIGDVATLDDSFLELTNNSTYSGNAYIEGSFDTGTATPSVTMSEDDAFFVKNLLKINTNPPDASKLVDGALFYAGITQLWNSGSSFGSATNRVNLVTGRFESHSDQKQFYGRIFADQFDVITKADGTPTLGSTVSDPFSARWEDKIHGNVYTDYLGVPSDAVYVEFTKDSTGHDIAVFKLNYDSTGAAIPEADDRRIEKRIGVDGQFHVLHGISIINNVQAQDFGGRPNFVNIHESRTAVDPMGSPLLDSEHNAITIDYFTDYRSIDPLVYDNNNLGRYFKYTEETPHLNTNIGANPKGTTYRVFIDWSNFDVDNINFQVEYQYQADYADTTISGYPKDLNVDYDADVSENVWTLDDQYRKVFKLPKISGHQLQLVGTNESTFKLPTHRSIYNSYFYGSITGGETGSAFPQSFDDDTGAFKMDPADTSYNFDKFIAEHAISSEAILAGIDTEGPVDIDNIPSFTNMTTPVAVAAGGGDTVNNVTMPTWARVISSSGYIPANGGDNSVYYIDARSSDIDLQLGDGGSNQTFTGTYVVYGDNHVTITVPGNITGGDGQTVYLGSGGSPFSIMTEEIYSGKCKDILVIGDPVSGKLGGEITTAPNIDWYFSSKTITTANLQTGGSGMTAFCGYIIAPTVFFDIKSNINGLKRETWYYGDRIPSSSDNDKYTIFGSIFCKQYRGGQHAGVCYIPRDDGYVDDGSKPLLNKVGMYRTRS
ncbi:MAG: hypothetical protein SOZ56_11275 [Oscillospiraceae bacterium]|nr:hypothetical protein [Oscillospiraceae bacterium]